MSNRLMKIDPLLVSNYKFVFSDEENYNFKFKFIDESLIDNTLEVLDNFGFQYYLGKFWEPIINGNLSNKLEYIYRNEISGKFINHYDYKIYYSGNNNLLEFFAPFIYNNPDKKFPDYFILFKSKSNIWGSIDENTSKIEIINLLKSNDVFIHKKFHITKYNIFKSIPDIIPNFSYKEENGELIVNCIDLQYKLFYIKKYNVQSSQYEDFLKTELQKEYLVLANIFNFSYYFNKDNNFQYYFGFYFLDDEIKNFLVDRKYYSLGCGLDNINGIIKYDRKTITEEDVSLNVNDSLLIIEDIDKNFYKVFNFDNKAFYINSKYDINKFVSYVKEEYNYGAKYENYKFGDRNKTYYVLKLKIMENAFVPGNWIEIIFNNIPYRIEFSNRKCCSNEFCKKNGDGVYSKVSSINIEDDVVNDKVYYYATITIDDDIDFEEGNRIILYNSTKFPDKHFEFEIENYYVENSKRHLVLVNNIFNSYSSTDEIFYFYRDYDRYFSSILVGVVEYRNILTQILELANSINQYFKVEITRLNELIFYSYNPFEVSFDFTYTKDLSRPIVYINDVPFKGKHVYLGGEKLLFARQRYRNINSYVFQRNPFTKLYKIDKKHFMKFNEIKEKFVYDDINKVYVPLEYMKLDETFIVSEPYVLYPVKDENGDILKFKDEEGNFLVSSSYYQDQIDEFYVLFKPRILYIELYN